MEPTTVSWLAALIDGEGSVMLTARRTNKNWRPVVSIYNTDLRLIEALKEKTGGGAVYTHTRSPKENHKLTAYSWRMRGHEIRAWLPLCLPWLFSKREQAVLLLEAMAMKGDMATSKGKKLLPLAVRERNQVRMAEIGAEISSLNRRGRMVPTIVSPLP